MQDQASAAAGIITAAQRIWIGTHLDPDGDAIGSLLGLGQILRRAGKPVRLACQDPLPPDFRFLVGSDSVESNGPRDEDLIIALDAADAGRLGRLHDPARWQDRKVLVIDHHASNPGFGSFNWIDPSAASTAEMLVELIDPLALDVDPDAATALLTGIVTDTIGFRTSNTSARSLRAAERMVAAGAPLAEISQRIFYSQPLAGIRLLGLALARMQQQGDFVLTWLLRQDFEDVGAAPGDARELTRVLASAAEPLAIAVLRERRDGGFDLSMRSKPGFSLLKAAAALGGGGHPQASGARLSGSLESARSAVFAALEAGGGRAP
jgi:phosphoesterase RecJ-like protein